MALAKDIKLTESGDLLINAEKGDFEVRESDTQHVQDIVNSYAGWWKEFPTVGVGARLYSSSSGTVQRLSRAVKVQLNADGYDAKIEIVNNQLFITGKRRNVNL